ncbi:hypothetical protein [Ensifer sp.]|uniref:hypothetical protein n=1 Tax=Ensifer sp. TaxID=1872086 RepID=UPI00289D26EF|nr:hypothetical protein [Ensifer sp.]
MQHRSSHFDCAFSPAEIAMLQRVLNTACLAAGMPRSDYRADRLAKFIIGEFRSGIRAEAALCERALWFERRSAPWSSARDH